MTDSFISLFSSDSDEKIFREKSVAEPVVRTHSKGSAISHRNVVRLCHKDKGSIKSLMDLFDMKQTTALFGEVDLDEHFNKSWLIIGLRTDVNDLIGVMFLGNFPTNPAVPPWDWDNWIKNFYNIHTLTSMNTIWIRLMMWQPAFYYLFMRPMVQFLFYSKPYFEYIAIIVPPPCREFNDGFLNKLGGSRIRPHIVQESSLKKVQSLHIFPKQIFVKNYVVRRAVPEDNDDIIPIIEKYSPELTAVYGKYFISEMLSIFKTPDREILVIEDETKVVGVVCINSNVNYEVLNQEFELVCFNGFKKRHAQDPAFFNVLQKIDSDFKLVTDSEMVKGDLAFTSRANRLSEDDYLVSISSESEYSLVFTAASIFYYQDEDFDDDDENLELNKSSVSGSQQDNDKISTSSSSSSSSLSSVMLFPDSSSDSASTFEHFPSFLGEPNAFALEIIAVEPGYESSIPVLLKSMYTVFTDREYCLLSLPSNIYLNLLLAYFSRVVPRQTGKFEHELYFMHSSFLKGNLNIQLATKEHSTKVKTLLSTICWSNIVWAQFENYLEDPKSNYTAVVVLNDDEVVGVTTISEEMEFDYLKCHYDLFPLQFVHTKLSTQGIVESLIISPIFHMQASWILREIHRLTQYDVLYYKIKPYGGTNQLDRPFNNLISRFIHVFPTKLPEYDVKQLVNDGYIKSTYQFEEKETYALYISTIWTCFKSRIENNTKIVVDGCSNTAIAFLLALFYTKETFYSIMFNNVTIICSEWIRRLKISQQIREAFRIKKYFFDGKYLDSANLKSNVNVVDGKITEINRNERFVVIDNKKFLSYDLLFMMAGEKFVIPYNMIESSTDETPDNVFLINNAYDANWASQRLRSIISNTIYPDFKIVVYGKYLQAYVTIQGLLTYGVPGKHLVFVQPFPVTFKHSRDQTWCQNVSCFNDPIIDETVCDHIKEAGIQVYESHFLVDWEYNKDTRVVTKLMFESRNRMLSIDCLALFMFAKKDVSKRLFTAINNAGLVYDGRLVINRKFQTNDPNIYGAGTITKYSKKYCNKYLPHENYNRMEIGEKLGFQIKEMLLPHFLKKKGQQIEGWNFRMYHDPNFQPLFLKPIMRYCILPGGLYYLTISPPGKLVPLETAMSRDNYGHLLISGSPKELDIQSFIQLHFSSFNRLNGITILAKFPINIYNMHCLWDKHEVMLNSIFTRFENGQISDLYKFVHEPWALALYHKEFASLITELDNILSSPTVVDGMCLATEVIKRYTENEWKTLPSEEVDKLKKEFYNSTYMTVIQDKLLEFIGKNLCSLPVYAHPKVVKDLLINFEDSPMFE